MRDYSKRSYELELMDLPFERKEDLFENLKELELINKLTGGPRHTFNTLKKMLKGKQGIVTIVDIGYGAGDMLQYILDHKNELSCEVKLIGVDMLPEANEYAVSIHPELKSEVEFFTCDYREYMKSGNNVDVAIAGLFCHHLNDEQVTEFFSYINQHCKIGGVINDLARSPIAYYGIKIPTQLFSKSRFTKNDAPLSVLRGFARNELKLFLDQAGVKNYKIQWKWAYRYLISIYNHG
jgi:2-polyprenyl-3-methyl-5-hydroxy-6-metoxy-1,4-benzoquinol methylase